MDGKVLGYSTKFIVPSGAINPIDINEQILKDHSAIDDENKLDRSLYRVGSIGSNFVFANWSEDEIQIQPTEINIKSRNYDRISKIISVIKVAYSSVKPKTAEFNFGVHLFDEHYPSQIFSKYVHNKALNLDIIQFKNEDILITMFNCSKNTIHIRFGIERSIKSQFSDIIFDDNIEFQRMKELAQQFISEELSIDYTLNF